MVFILFETITFIMIKSDRLNHTNIVTTLYDTITFFFENRKLNQNHSSFPRSDDLLPQKINKNNIPLYKLKIPHC